MPHNSTNSASSRPRSTCVVAEATVSPTPDTDHGSVSTAATTTTSTHEILDRLNRDGHVVIENVIPRSTIDDLHARVDAILERERDNPVDPGDSDVTVEQADLIDYSLWRIDEVEEARLKRRIRHRQATEFDTPFPVDPNEALISFVHIPTFFDNGRSQRIFNSDQQGPSVRATCRAPVDPRCRRERARARPDAVRCQRQPRRSAHQLGRLARRHAAHVDGRAAPQRNPERADGMDARRLHACQRRHACRDGQPYDVPQATIRAAGARRRDRARRPRRFGGDLVVTDMAPPRRQRHRRWLATR